MAKNILLVFASILSAIILFSECGFQFALDVVGKLTGMLP